jgi:SOS response regulatory protein OraA/RecX
MKNKRLRRKLKENGYKDETIEKIIGFYTKGDVL